MAQYKINIKQFCTRFSFHFQCIGVSWMTCRKGWMGSEVFPIWLVKLIGGHKTYLYFLFAFRTTYIFRVMCLMLYTLAYHLVIVPFFRKNYSECFWNIKIFLSGSSFLTIEASDLFYDRSKNPRWLSTIMSRTIYQGGRNQTTSQWWKKILEMYRFFLYKKSCSSSFDLDLWPGSLWDF